MQRKTARQFADCHMHQAAQPSQQSQFSLSMGLGFENASSSTAVLVPGCLRNARIGTGRACLRNDALSASAEVSAIRTADARAGAGRSCSWCCRPSADAYCPARPEGEPAAALNGAVIAPCRPRCSSACSCRASPISASGVRRAPPDAQSWTRGMVGAIPAGPRVSARSPESSSEEAEEMERPREGLGADSQPSLAACSDRRAGREQWRCGALLLSRQGA